MPAVPATVRLLIVGAGFGGIGMAMRLRQRGIDDFLIVDKGADVGGVWRDNHYPGAACDVPSHLYSFSFAPWTGWSRRFAPQAEILAYLRDCVQRHDLRRHLRLSTEIASAQFSESDGHWQVETASGEIIHAQFLIMACGQLSRPLVPALEGIETFPGQRFHSARWPEDFSAADRRIAVVGSGASAIQFLPPIAEQARQIHLFQRTPSHVIAKPDRIYRPWERRLQQRFPLLAKVIRAALYLQHETRALGFISFPALLGLMRWEFRRHLRRSIADPALREKLTPTYPLGCKRILIFNDYYPALARSNVEVVGERIARVDGNEIETEDGQRRTVDTIIFGTGFAATEFLAPMRIIGREGRDLRSEWHAGAEAYRGTSVNGYPNLFVLYGPNTNLGHNSIIYMLESQFRYVLSALTEVQRRGLAWFDVKADAQARYNAGIQRAAQHTVFTRGCHSWYQTADGRHTNNWPGYTFYFRWLTRRPHWPDFEFAPASSGPPQATLLGSRL